MEESSSKRPVIVIKKKGGHGGHHGGAWKVAYADFVTAMMALFIVLWLLSSSEKVKKAVSGYFKDPAGTGQLTGSSMASVGEAITVKKDDMSKLKEKLMEAMRTLPEFQKMKNHVELTVTSEGLRIELLETEGGMFFESGKAEPTEAARELLGSLSEELAKLPNHLLIEGHTDARPYAGNGPYTNWELSTDRANMARRLMQSAGLRPDQVVEVRGYADQRLRDQAHPDAAANRRVSVIVQYLKPTGGEADETPAKAAPVEAPKAAAAAAHH